MSKPVAHECTCSQQLIELRREMEELRSATRMKLQDDHESNTDFESDKENQQKRKRKSKNPVAISNLVYIFIDDSNVTHEGSRELNIGKGFNFNVDYNRLVITVLNGRTLGKVYIVGSTPPPPPNRCDNCNGLGHHARECSSPINNRGVNTPKAENQQENVQRDELERAKGLGFIVKTFQRNAENKEKKVDVQLTCDIMNTIRDENPGKLVLVAGDSDYSIPLNEAKKMNWEVETWFWPGGMSSDFKNWPHSSLKNHYKSFVYITGSTKNKHTTLEISGDVIKSWKWRNEPIMECFCSFGYFCQLYWVNNTTAYLYFDNEAHLKSVKGWLSNKYPNMLIKEQENDNRRRSHGKNPPRPANSNHSSTPSQKTDSPLADQMINGGPFS